MKKLLTTGTLTSYRPRVDGSFNLTVNVMIPSKEQRDVIADLFQQEVVIYLREGSEVAKEEIEVVDEIDIELGNTKSKSQRLRASMYIAWSQKPEGFKTFREYYEWRMEKIITYVKSALD